MSKKFLTDIDLAKNQLLSARIHNAASPPLQALSGQVYFDTNLGKLRIFDGVNWIDSIQGTQGLQGTAGYMGADGPQGIQGTQGIQGSYGIQGFYGAQGIQGTQGVIGDKGIVVQATPPTNTDILWLDTTINYSRLTQRKHDWVSGASTSYEGIAEAGILTSQAFWKITKIVVNNDGTATVSVAYNAIWDNRYTETYA